MLGGLKSKTVENTWVLIAFLAKTVEGRTRKESKSNEIEAKISAKVTKKWKRHPTSTM